MNTQSLLIALSLLAASLAHADTFVDTFEGGTNHGAWSYGTVFGRIEPTGGNPGAFFHDDALDTYAPQFRTYPGYASPFTGDYRARQVTSLGVDLILFRVDFSAEGRPLSLILENDNATPFDPSDDWGAYFIGPDNVPLVGQGWRSYDFGVPSQAASLPAGWALIDFGPNVPPQRSWSRLIADVDGVNFFYGNPENFFVFQMWDVGADNARLGMVPAPPGALLLALAAARRRDRR